jgi:hypothetical protein
MKFKNLARLPIALIPLNAAVTNAAELCTYPILNHTVQIYFKDVTGLINIREMETIASVKEPTVICIKKVATKRNISSLSWPEEMHPGRLVNGGGILLNQIGKGDGKNIDAHSELAEKYDAKVNEWQQSMRQLISQNTDNDYISEPVTPHSTAENRDDALRNCKTNWGKTVRIVNYVAYFPDRKGNSIQLSTFVFEPSRVHLGYGEGTTGSFGWGEAEITRPCSELRGNSWLNLSRTTHTAKYIINRNERVVLAGVAWKVYLGAPTSKRSGQQGSF